MVLVSIAGGEVAADADYGEVLDQLRRSARPLELRFRLPDVLEDEDDHPDGPVEHEGVLCKLERDTSFHRGYLPHSRFFVLRADGLEYFRLFLAGVHGMGDTVTSGAGRALPFSGMQAVVAGSDLPPELIGARPTGESSSPIEERPHWALEDEDEDGGGGGGRLAGDDDDPFAQTFALSSPVDRSLDLDLEPESEPASLGNGASTHDGPPPRGHSQQDQGDGRLSDQEEPEDPEQRQRQQQGLATADDGAECRFTIVMGDRFVGSGGYRKPWRLYRLQADSAAERDAWLGCIRGGMARYREHGPWALRSRERGAHALRHGHGAGTGTAGGTVGMLGMAAMHVVSATVARTLIVDGTNRRDDEGASDSGGGPSTSNHTTPRAAGAAAAAAAAAAVVGGGDGVAGSSSGSFGSLWQRPYTRYIIEYRTEANTHGEVARRFDEFRQLHAQVLEPACSPAAPLVLPPPTDLLADKNDPELVEYRAAALQQYISSAVRLVSRLNAPPVSYALDHFLTHLHQQHHHHPPGFTSASDSSRVQLGGSKAVADLLCRQQLWDAVGHWRGEESSGLLGVTMTDDSGSTTGRRARAWLSLHFDPDGTVEMRVAHEGSLLAVLLGRWQSCSEGRRVHLSLSGSSSDAAASTTVAAAAESAAASAPEEGEDAIGSRDSGSSGGSTAWMIDQNGGNINSTGGDGNGNGNGHGHDRDRGRGCNWRLEMIWRKVCVETGGRRADSSREYTVFHISCVQTMRQSNGGAAGAETEVRRWVVSQRYSVFASLRELLLGSVDDWLAREVALLDELFPPKEGAAAWVMPRSSTLGAERQAGLLGWLRAVHRLAPQHPAVVAFLAPPETKSTTASGDDPYIHAHANANADANADADAHGNSGSSSDLGLHLGLGLDVDGSGAMGIGIGSGRKMRGSGSSVSTAASAGDGLNVHGSSAAGLGRHGSDEFVMPDGDDEEYPYAGSGGDSTAGAASAAALSGRATGTAAGSNGRIGIQGLNTPRAADATSAAATAAAAAAAASPSRVRRSESGPGAVVAGTSSGPGPAPHEEGHDEEVELATTLRLSSGGPPTVHNAGIGWTDTFGNAVERRRLVLESCLCSDGAAAAASTGSVGRPIGPERSQAEWKHYAEGDVRT
jgi:hypothetical protein